MEERIKVLEAEIIRRDNLLKALGVRMPDDEPMRWEYRSKPGRMITTDGIVRCPKCKGVFHRIVGMWYKHCPECGKRLAMREECG